MASSGNFCTYSSTNVQGPAGSGTYTATKGNLGGTTTSGSATWVGTTFGLPSGKWYWEARSTGATSGWPRVGFHSMGAGGDSISSLTTEDSNNLSSLRIVHNSGCGVGPFGSTSVTEITGSVSSGDIVQIAIDVDAGKIWYGVNNTYLESGNPATGANAIDDYTAATYNPVMPCVGTYNSQALPDLNFGQDDTFAGAISSAGNADGNGFGAFKYSPPSGFLSLCSANLPISDDIDPAQTDDDIPQKQFGVVTWTGDGTTSRAITGLGFQPDFIWFKSRGSAFSNRLYDTSRGISSTGGKRLFSNTNAVESNQTSGQDVSAVGADGFTLGASSNLYTNDTNDGGIHVAWAWKANGGTTATDSTGTITSSVQANTKGGFSIVTYTGTGTAATIGHGLGKAPELIFVKNRDATDDWAVYHVSNGNTHYMILNSNGGKTDNTYWNDTSPTSSVFSIGTDHKLNASTEKYVSYCWAPIEGYSKFGVYTSNQNADGPFNYTGFRPKMIFVKMVVSGDGWGVWDSERSPTNVMDEMLRWDSSNARATGSPYQVDFLANGFKVRTDNAQMNHNSYDPYIWGAWGDVPYKYNNGF